MSARKWLIGGLASLALSSAASAQLTLSLDPPTPGPGDDVEIVLTGGTEGDYTLVLVALDGGPTTFPLIGTLEVGLSSLTLYPLGQFDASGSLRFPCALDCFAAEVDPFFMQGIAVRLVTGVGPIVSGITNPLVLAIDDNKIQDCNNNGIDDDCDIEEGFSEDCNENGIPDECETTDCNGNRIPDDCDIASGTSLDANGNGIPDECEPDCNGNGIPDDLDIRNGTSEDCDGNGEPDECQEDCDGDGIPDVCDPTIDSYCIENMADDGCRNVVSRVVWIGDLSEPHFILVDGGQFIEHPDGTATFSGIIERIDDANRSFMVDMIFTGRLDPGDAGYPPVGSPKISGSCDMDEENWRYYSDFAGTFTGLGCYDGAVYDISPRGPAFQIGMGGNLFNERFGGSAWFTMTQISGSTGGCSLSSSMEGDFNFDLVNGCDCDPGCVGIPAWPTEDGTWELSGSLAVFPFGPDESYTVDCMTARYDGDDLHVDGQASGPDGTIVLDMTFTVFESGSDLQSNDGSNDYGSITHVESNTTIQLRGKVEPNRGYAFRMESTGAGFATLEGWFADSSGNLIGDFGPNPAEGVCEDPCD